VNGRTGVRLSAEERLRVEEALESWLGRVPPHRVAARFEGLFSRSYRVILLPDARESAPTPTHRAEPPGTDVVVRLPGNRRPFGVDRTVEARAARAAALVGVGPEVRHADTATGLLIVDTVRDGRPSTRSDLRRPEVLEAVAGAFRTLHATPPLGRAMDPRAVLAAYRGRLAGAEAWSQRGGFRRLLERAQRIADSLDLSASRVPSHGDPTPGNVLVTDLGDVRLVDFEYAADADPHWDLAEFLASARLDPAASRRLLDASGMGDETTVAVARWRVVCDAIAGAWAFLAGEDALSSRRLGACSRGLAHLDAQR
jgi:hypothetical protein